jgi:CheY-like chemotaxis protein
VPDVLILGCGFTGRRVARRVRALGYTVHGTHRDTLNLENPCALSTLACMVTPGIRVLHSIPTLADDLDRLAVGALEGAARVVYLSTTGVYGEAEFVDETTPAAPVSDRAEARLRTERAVQDGPWSSLVLRPAAIYGPGRIVRYARSSACVSRIHVDDLAAHAEAALFSDVSGAWPVADDHPCPTSEILEYLGQDMGWSAPGPLTRPAPTNRRVNGAAIRRKLGITLKHPSYKEGIPASNNQPRPCRVFLAEDNPADVYLIREAFHQHNLDCELNIADNGEDAIRFLRTLGHDPEGAPPDLLMLDLNLPRVDGGQLLKACRENPPCARIPLMVLSSADAEQDLRASGQLPKTALFFHKPTELDAFLDLGALVKQVLTQGVG